MKKGLAIFLGLFVIAGIFFGPDIIEAIKKNSQFNKTFSVYTSLLVSGDYANAYKISCPEFQEKISYDSYVEIHSLLESNRGKLIDIEKGRQEVSGKGTPRNWTAVLNTNHIYVQDPCSFRYTFHLIEGKWKLFAMKQIETE